MKDALPFVLAAGWVLFVASPFLWPTHTDPRLRQCLKFKDVADAEGVIVCKNGEYREVLVTFGASSISGKRTVIAGMKDISELVKKLEVKIRERTDELIRINRKI